MRELSWTSALIFLIAISFAIDEAGLYSRQWNTAISAFGLVVGAVLLPRQRRSDPSRKSRVALVLGTAAGILGIAMLALPQRAFGLGAYFLGLAAVSKAHGQRNTVLSGFGIGCLLYGMTEAIFAASSLVWHGTEFLTTRTSEILSHLVGQRASYGPTASGLGSLLLLGFVLLGVRVKAASHSSRAFRFAALMLPICWFLSLQLRSTIPSTPRSGILSFPFEFLRSIHPLHTQVLGPLLMSVPVLWYLRQDHGVAPERRSPRAATVLACLAIVVSGTLQVARTAPTRDGGTIALYEKGFLNWGYPTTKAYGRGSHGMLGMLPEFLRARGSKPKMLTGITREALEGMDALILINQHDPLPPEAIEAISEFVRGGGGLLVAGDHTTWRHGGVILNQPLEMTNIRFRFDNAEFFVGGWLHSAKFWPHHITADLNAEENTSASVIGASLDTSYPAIPMVVGKYGFSDPGELSAESNGYMGNRKYDPEERLGDLVLVAGEDVGRGRVLVLGDTTALSNGVLSHSWPFLTRAFDWLLSESRAGVPLTLELIALLLLVLALLATCLATSSSLAAGVPILAASILVQGILPEPPWASKAPRPLRSFAAEGDHPGRALAIIDESHISNLSREGLRENGIGGLSVNLIREGFFPIRMRRFEERQLREASLFICVAPTKEFSERETKALEAWVRQGGTLLLSIGRDHRVPVEHLLAHSGFDLQPMPLGLQKSVVKGSELAPQSFCAWKIEGGETLATILGHGWVSQASLGTGRVILIGDSQFLFDKNFESDAGVAMENIRFFSKLVSDAKGG